MYATSQGHHAARALSHDSSEAWLSSGTFPQVTNARLWQGRNQVAYRAAAFHSTMPWLPAPLAPRPSAAAQLLVLVFKHDVYLDSVTVEAAGVDHLALELGTSMGGGGAQARGPQGRGGAGALTLDFGASALDASAFGASQPPAALWGGGAGGRGFREVARLGALGPRKLLCRSITLRANNAGARLDFVAVFRVAVRGTPVNLDDHW